MFAREGAKVVVTGRRPEPLEEVAAETGGLAVAGDTADDRHVRATVATAVEAFGGLDVVVANAGLGFGGAAADVDDERWQRTLDVNLTGAFRLARAAIPALIERGGGSIVLISSVNALVSGSESAAYGTSKAAMNGLARSLAVDYGPKGIRANAICPGWVITEMGDRAMEDLVTERGISTRRGLRARDPVHPAPAAGDRRRDRRVLPVPRERRVLDRHRNRTRGRRRRARDGPHRGRVAGAAVSFDHSGRIAMITGAGSGIGRATALRLASQGAAVAVVDIQLEAAEETVASIADGGGTGVAFDADVRDRSEIESARDGAVNAFGHIDYLVNNAGLVRMSPLDELSEDEWDLVLDTNLKGMYLVTQAIAPVIAGAGGGRDREPRDDRVRGGRRLHRATRRCTTTRRRAA